MYPITIDPTMVWMDNRLQSALVSSFTGHRNVNIINGENIEVQNCGRNFAPYTNTEYMCFISTEGLPYTGNMDEFYGARIESAIQDNKNDTYIQEELRLQSLVKELQKVAKDFQKKNGK